MEHKNPNLKSGTYLQDDLPELIFSIGEGENVVIFAESFNHKIIMDRKSVLKLFVLTDGTSQNKISVIQDEDGSSSIIRILNLSKNSDIKVEVETMIGSSDSRSDIDILSLAGENGKIKIDSRITVGENTRNTVAKIDQENIFLGESGNISGIPALLIRSDDTRSRHSMKIERIREEDLFYLSSRGIDKTNATAIMLEGKIRTLFSGLEKSDFILDKLHEFLDATK